MDWNNPLRSIARTVDPDVLKVLAGAHLPLTGRRVSVLAGRSYAQVHAVLARLAADGLVTVERHGQANSFLLNRDHLVVPGLLAVLGAGNRLTDVIGAEAASWVLPAVTICLFGSASRGEALPSSDVDLLVVRPDTVDQDNRHWRDAVAALAQRVELVTGNRTQVVELSESEIQMAAAQGQPLTDSLRAGARTVFGLDVRLLLAQDGSGS